ncbi:hypothetical protein BH10PSE7_BH10PSE7_30080 [soil metagenome]
MKYPKNEIIHIIASLPRIRSIGIPFNARTGCIVVFSDAAHLKRDGKALAPRFRVPPLYTAPDIHAADIDLSDACGVPVIKFEDVRTRIERIVAIQVGTPERRNAVNAGNAVTRQRRPVFYFSANPVPDLKPMPAFFENNSELLERTVNAFEDEESVLCYLSRVKAIMYGDSGYIRISDYAQYIHPAVKAEEGDIVCEGGIGPQPFTTLMMAEAAGARGAVYAFEPVPDFCQTARGFVAEHGNITIVDAGLWSKDDKMDLYLADHASTFTPTAKTVENRKVTCALTSVDIYFDKLERKPSLIKLDIEGAEAEALDGAETTIRTAKPKLQVCLYHRHRHFLELPLKMLMFNPQYRFYIGHHTPLNNECVLYAG